MKPGLLLLTIIFAGCNGCHHYAAENKGGDRAERLKEFDSVHKALQQVSNRETALSSTDSSRVGVGAVTLIDTSSWIESFRQLRDAIYQANKPKAKTFFTFPFEGDDIWYMVYAHDEKALDTLESKGKMFTEKDFDQYFDRIFPKMFIKCLLKIKADDLYKKGASESPEFKERKTTYKLYTRFIKDENKIELNLATKTPYKISDTEYENGESNYIYYFRVLPNGDLRFERVVMAG